MFSRTINNFVSLAFVVLLITSFFLLKIFGGHYIQSVMAGALPLSLYFLIVFSVRNRISKNQIDTVYYFGFLITILTLGLSAYEFKSDGVIDISSITKQFSVGLIATGVALIYRLILISTESRVDDSTEEIKIYTEAVKQLRVEISQMFLQFETWSRSFSELTTKSLESATFTQEKTMLQLEAIHAKSLEIISSSLEKAVGSSMEELKKSSTEASTTIQLFKTNIGSVAKSTELKKVNDFLSKLGEAFDGFSDTISRSTSNISSSAKVLNIEQLKLSDVVSGTTEVSKALVAMRKTIEEEQENALAAKMEYTKSMDDLTETIKNLVTELRRNRRA